MNSKEIEETKEIKEIYELVEKRGWVLQPEPNDGSKMFIATKRDQFINIKVVPMGEKLQYIVTKTGHPSKYLWTSFEAYKAVKEYLENEN